MKDNGESVTGPLLIEDYALLFPQSVEKLGKGSGERTLEQVQSAAADRLMF